MPGVQCIPQRAALLKSMLNFLKKAIQDPAFSDGIRHGILILYTAFSKNLIDYQDLYFSCSPGVYPFIKHT